MNFDTNPEQVSKFTRKGKKFRKIFERDEDNTSDTQTATAGTSCC